MRFLAAVLASLGLLAVAAPVLAQASDPAVTPAPDVAPATNLNSMPKWSEFPVMPTNVPTAADIKQQVEIQNAKKTALQQEVAALVWDKQEPDAIANDAKSRLAPSQQAPVDAVMTPAQIDAFAAQLRAKAAPPPLAD